MKNNSNHKPDEEDVPLPKKWFRGKLTDLAGRAVPDVLNDEYLFTKGDNCYFDTCTMDGIHKLVAGYLRQEYDWNCLSLLPDIARLIIPYTGNIPRLGYLSADDGNYVLASKFPLMKYVYYYSHGWETRITPLFSRRHQECDAVALWPSLHLLREGGMRVSVEHAHCRESGIDFRLDIGFIAMENATYSPDFDFLFNYSWFSTISVGPKSSVTNIIKCIRADLDTIKGKERRGQALTKNEEYLLEQLALSDIRGLFYVEYLGAPAPVGKAIAHFYKSFDNETILTRRTSPKYTRIPLNEMTEFPIVVDMIVKQDDNSKYIVFDNLLDYKIEMDPRYTYHVFATTIKCNCRPDNTSGIPVGTTMKFETI